MTKNYQLQATRKIGQIQQDTENSNQLMKLKMGKNIVNAIRKSKAKPQIDTLIMIIKP